MCFVIIQYNFACFSTNFAICGIPLPLVEFFLYFHNVYISIFHLEIRILFNFLDHMTRPKKIEVCLG